MWSNGVGGAVEAVREAMGPITETFLEVVASRLKSLQEAYELV